MARLNGRNILTVVRTTYLNVAEAYPVGSIYMSINSTSPASLFGGTWERMQDTFLLAAGSTYAAGATGGEATHQLTINEMPSHDHDLYAVRSGGYDTYGVPITETWSGGSNKVTNAVGTGGGYNQGIQAKGGGAAHNNMPPYTAVYVWKRTA
jgi:hypothetical protein